MVPQEIPKDRTVSARAHALNPPNGTLMAHSRNGGTGSPHSTVPLLPLQRPISGVQFEVKQGVCASNPRICETAKMDAEAMSIFDSLSAATSN